MKKRLNGMIVAQKRLLSDISNEEEELNIWIGKCVHITLYYFLRSKVTDL